MRRRAYCAPARCRSPHCDIDLAGFDLLLVDAPPALEAWWAVNDRLMRAAGGRSPPTLAP